MLTLRVPGPPAEAHLRVLARAIAEGDRLAERVARTELREEFGICVEIDRGRAEREGGGR